MKKIIFAVIIILIILGLVIELLMIRSRSGAIQELPGESQGAVPKTSNVRIPSIDNDGDGIPDEDEIIFGTDPFKADTDGDGISDGEEIAHYRTDPLNPDTDGDGFTDGQEVKAGYDPRSTEPIELH